MNFFTNSEEAHNVAASSAAEWPLYTADLILNCCGTQIEYDSLADHPDNLNFQGGTEFIQISGYYHCRKLNNYIV